MSNEDTTAEPVVAIDVAATNAEATVVAAVPVEPKKLYDLKSDDLSQAKNYRIPEPDEGEVIIWRSTASARRAKAFRELKCYIYDYNSNRWWDNNRGNWSKDRLRLPPVTVEHALSLTSPYAMLLFYVRVEAEDPSKPKRRCRVDQYLESNLIEMLKLWPNNATFRANVMALINEMPPPEADTYDKIKDWVEFNFPRDVVEPPKPPEVKMYDIPITGNIYESGRCRYSTTKRVRGNVRISESTIRDMLSEHNNEEDVMAAIHDHIEAGASSETVDDEEITDHHEADDGSTEVEYDRAFIRNIMLGIAQRALTQQEYDDFIQEQ